jgi:hypothetical protein
VPTDLHRRKKTPHAPKSVGKRLILAQRLGCAYYRAEYIEYNLVGHCYTGID